MGIRSLAVTMPLCEAGRGAFRPHERPVRFTSLNESEDSRDHESKVDIAKVQEWLRHANVSTTCLYDRRKTRPEDSPKFHVKY